MIQKKFRERLHKRRLNCKNLADRLIFESDLMIGTVRLFKQILVFGLLIGALNISSNEQVKRGIYIELDNSFDFDGLQAVLSRDEFISTWVPAISASSKKYFIRSSTYFDSGGAGAVELHTGTALFTESKLLGGLELSIQLPSFSFTAWVQMVPEFVQGYIFRKRLQPAGSGSELSCWGKILPCHTLSTLRSTVPHQRSWRPCPIPDAESLPLHRMALIIRARRPRIRASPHAAPATEKAPRRASRRPSRRAARREPPSVAPRGTPRPQPPPLPAGWYLSKREGERERDGA
jgi:hypothetical protein